MSKSLWDMNAHELIEYELNGGELGITGDLETALANKLTEAIDLLVACVKQCEEYSDNELVIDWETNKSYSIDEIKEFIGTSNDTTTS